MEVLKAELLLDAQAELGEAPLWDVARQRLWWVDIEPGLLHCFDPASGNNDTYNIDQRVGVAVNIGQYQVLHPRLERPVEAPSATSFDKIRKTRFAISSTGSPGAMTTVISARE